MIRRARSLFRERAMKLQFGHGYYFSAALDPRAPENLRFLSLKRDQGNSGLRNPVFLARVDELSAASDRVWLSALTVGLGFTLIAAYVFPFSPSGKFWAYAGLFVRASLFLWAGEALRGRGGETLAALFKLGFVGFARLDATRVGLCHCGAGISVPAALRPLAEADA